MYVNQRVSRRYSLIVIAVALPHHYQEPESTSSEIMKLLYGVLTIFAMLLVFSCPASSSEPFPRIPQGVWTSYDQWARSTPGVNDKYAAATTVVEFGIDNSSHELMMMYGGVGYTNHDMITWLYDPQQNVWQSLRPHHRPHVTAYHSMVTLCDRQVVLFGGADTRNEQGTTDVYGPGCKNETWIFDMSRKEWRFLDATVVDDGFILPRCTHAATVLYQHSVGCVCKDSMFIYGGKFFAPGGSGKEQNDLFDLWELRCIKDGDENGLSEFQWISIGFSLNTSLKAISPQAISVFNKSTLILSGWKDSFRRLWSLNMVRRVWTERGKPQRLNSIRMVYMTEKRTYSTPKFHILVACCKGTVSAFDLEANLWYKPKQPVNVATPQMRSDTSTVTTVGDNILVFGGDLNFRSPEETLWNLSVLGPDFLYWTAIETESPKLKHKGGMVGGIVEGNTIVLFGGILSEPRTHLVSSDETWSLDLTTMRWSKEAVTEKPPGLFASAGAVLHNGTLVIFGGVEISFRQGYVHFATFTNSAFGFNYSQRKWFELEIEGSPSKRAFHTVLAVNDSTMIVLGGFTPILQVGVENGIEFEPCLDVWTFTLGCGPSIVGTEWSRLHDTGPHTYIGHSASVFNRHVVVYGGTHTVITLPYITIKRLLPRKMFISGVIAGHVDCEDAMWEYDIDMNDWKKLNYTSNTGPGARCFQSTARVGNNMIIHGGCSKRAELFLHLSTYTWNYTCSIDASTTGVWSYSRNAGTWTRLTATQPLYSVRILSLMLEWKGKVVSFGGVSFELSLTEKDGDWTGFSVYKPECPPGTYAFHFQTTGCQPCAVGFYSSSPVLKCVRCPDGLLTQSTGSTSVENCSVCISSICGHGQCRVIVPGPQVYCECDFGFTKNDDGVCSIATYFLAGSGLVAGIVLFAFAAAMLVRLRKAKKGHRVALRDKGRELCELTNGWTVDYRELKLQCRIDTMSPGGFGDVYKAEYHEMTVAVKKLKEVMLDLERTEMEFEREIQVMRTIRHPNIVLFLGVGRFRDDGCPFIVMEFMSRGSLGSILRNSSISLSSSQQIRFAMDAGKGMRFLHGLHPPRIHRDLKSGNLLVSERWVVKVADFGSARLVKEEAVAQDAVRGTGPLSLNAPLLEPHYELSTCVGTPFWTAPELLRGLSYGTAVDIYR